MADAPLSLVDKRKEVDPWLVDRCENLLAMARRGDIRSMTYATVAPDGQTTRVTHLHDSVDGAQLYCELVTQQRFIMERRAEFDVDIDGDDLPKLDDDDDDLIDEDPPAERCPCGGFVLADTEDWQVPRCYTCWTRMGQPDEEPSG